MGGLADFQRTSCPVQRNPSDRVLLGHGSGGKLSADLLQRVILPAFGAASAVTLDDAATLALPLDHAKHRLAFTTDSFVVQPLFFAGGNIGSLAVHGTINDLAVAGAQPLYLSAAFVLEEGLPIDSLRQICAAMGEACLAAKVSLVAGDTKVVDRGKGDGIFITTTGIGILRSDVSLSAGNARPGDRILLSGPIGDHGMAIMSERESLEFESALRSDTASLHEVCARVLETSPRVRVMRDPTRGGLASALNEIAASSRVGMHLDEAAIPVRPEVRAACELLGIDPLHVANEGKVVVIVPPEDAASALAAMRDLPVSREAMEIGCVVEEPAGIVAMKSRIGGTRIVPMLAGEQLPRIC